MLNLRSFVTLDMQMMSLSSEINIFPPKLFRCMRHRESQKPLREKV
jgi:hypothetical protein